MNIYIYGRGYGLSFVKRCLSNSVTIKAYIDNYTREDFDTDGITIIRKEDIEDEYDFVLISIIKYEDIKNDLIEYGVASEKIICFFSREDADNECYYSVLDPYKWKTELIWKYLNEVVRPSMENMYYELNAERLKKARRIPRIIDPESAIKLIIDEHKSLARFGDGEFEIMQKRDRPGFQVVNLLLAERLREVLETNDRTIMIAIANNYGDLSDYTDNAANAIRCYLSPKIREEHLSLLDLKRDYYDAYLSRPYIIYRDKSKDKIIKKFELLKEIWNGQNVLMIEGAHTRFGVGNDLLDGAKSVSRVITPDKNAFAFYEAILGKAKEFGKNRLILSALGPTATVLAYDLAIEGYRAIDIGQVDTEYEWFIRGVTERCNIPGKTVSEYADKSVYEELEEGIRKKYEEEIVAVVC